MLFKFTASAYCKKTNVQHLQQTVYLLHADKGNFNFAVQNCTYFCWCSKLNVMEVSSATSYVVMKLVVLWFIQKCDCTAMLAEPKSSSSDSRKTINLNTCILRWMSKSLTADQYCRCCREKRVNFACTAAPLDTVTVFV